MTQTLRQRISALKNFDELVYIAVLGSWSTNSGSNPCVSYKTLFGDSGSISAGATKELWPAPVAMGIPTAAETLAIVSSSIQDDAGGSGIDAVFVEGLDANYLPIQELVVLDGTTTVNSVNSYIHVHELNCLNLTTSGTTNVGNITVTNSSSGDTLGYVLAGDGLSKHSQFLVPAGYNAIIMGGSYSVYRASGTGTRRARVDLELTPLDGGLGDRINYETLKLGGTSEGSLSELTFRTPLVVGPKVLIHPHAAAEANNTQVSVEYDLLLIETTIDIDSIF